MEEKKHRIVLDARSQLSMTDICEVISFNEEAMELLSGMGRIQITGVKLHIEKVSVDDGDILISGKISSIYYPDDTPQEKKGLLSRILG